ncbi:MAG TPA: hypothetical protein VL485_21685 [Ktedonobacteraceae bacterium]|jgi:small-conductance mechanosensitive channel|nr:hypothetical protein [Ktedonobacteraceae bacterium]
MPVIQNWGTAIISSLANALNLFLTFIPRFVGFLVILLVGWIIAQLVNKALTAVLHKVGFERLADRAGMSRLEQQTGVPMDAAGILGKVAFWFIFLIFLVTAIDALGLAGVSNMLNQIVSYLPNVFVAILILFVGMLAATVVGDLVRAAIANTRMGSPNVFANIARYAILGFAVLIALEQLQIAPSLINILFMAVVGAIALATGLAFGLGGQDTVRHYLSRRERTWESEAQYRQVQQSADQTQTQPQAIPDPHNLRTQSPYGHPIP